MAPGRPPHLARELARARLAHAQTRGLLVPLGLAQAWPMTAREMEELLAVSATVNWAKLKLCHYRGLWMIWGYVSEILRALSKKHDIKHTSSNQHFMFY